MKLTSDDNSSSESKIKNVCQKIKFDKDIPTIIQNWVWSLGQWDRLVSLIKLPVKIFWKLKKVIIQDSPPPKPKSEPAIWTKSTDGICWECLGIVLIRPAKSLKELKAPSATWKIRSTQK